MNNVEQEVHDATTERYKALISMTSSMENRLRYSEIIYFCLNVLVILFTVFFVSALVTKVNYVLTYMDYAFVFLILAIGISINVTWVTFAMRLHLKLKLRYFQARSIERKMNCPGEHIFSDEHIFFDPHIRHLKSFDNKERVDYPTEGITRMDGFIGSIKPRHFSWLLPCFFISIYWVIFILLATTL